MFAPVAAMTRRGAVKLVAALTALAPMGRTGAQAQSTPSTPEPPAAGQSLDAAQMAALGAMLARMLPSDENSGSAADAGAHLYIDGQLAGHYAALLPIYRQGLGALDAAAKVQDASSFAVLTPTAQDAIIGQMEQGKLTGTSLTDGGKTFFALARRHMLEGLLTDPMYGGNKDFAGWALVGFPGIQLNFNAQQQALNSKDPRSPHSIADFGGQPIP